MPISRRRRLRPLPAALVAIGVVLGACGGGDGGTSGPSAEAAPDADAPAPFAAPFRRLAEEVVAVGLPGVSLHVRLGEREASVVAGVAEIDSATPFLPTSPSLTASAGKPFVAVLLLRLVEDGLLALSDPLERRLDPALAETLPGSDAITLEMLLAHTSGLPDYLAQDDFWRDYLGEGERPAGTVWTAEEALGYVTGVEPRFPPGERFDYSNTNFVLAGLVAERASGLSLGAALRAWVLEPAGLEETYHPSERPGQPDLVHGYLDPREAGRPADDALVDTREQVRSDGLGDGPLHATARDLERFVRVLLDTETLLSATMRERMLTEERPGSGYGLGIAVDELPLGSGDGVKMWSHLGEWLGYSADFVYVPALDLSFAVMANGSGERFRALFKYLERRVLGALVAAADGD